MTVTSDAGATTRRSRTVVHLVVAGEVALSLVLGFHALGRKSLWADEGFSAMASNNGLRGVVGDTVDLRNMTGYHLLLSWWRQLGTSETMLRSLSVLATAACVVVVFALGRRLSGEPAGLAAGFLLALAPFAVRYSQEVRAYALLMLAVSLSSLLFVSAIERPTTRTWALYAVVAAASCYVHLFGGLVIAAELLSLAFLERGRVPRRQVAAVVVAIAALLVPLGLLVVDTGAAATSIPPSPRSFGSAVANVAGGKLLAIVVLGLGAVTVARGVITWRTDGRSLASWRAAFVALWLVAPYVLALLIAFVEASLWRDRYFIVVLPAVCIAAGSALSSLRTRRVAVAGLVGLIVVLAALKTDNWYRAPALEDWRTTTALVLDEGSPADGVVFCGSALRRPFEYYALRAPDRARPTPLSPREAWGDDVHANPAPERDVVSWRASPRRIWVLSRNVSPDEHGACDLDASMQGRSLAVDRVIGFVTVQRFDLE